MCPSKREGGGCARRQLTYQDRVDIEAGLNRGDTLSTIARTVGRAPKVVAAEVRRNWTDEPKGRLTVTTRNLCVHRSACVHVDLCKKGCLVRCCRCRGWLCNSVCPDFEAEICPRHLKAPYCCNCCPERLGSGCRYPYRFYEARYAHDLAERRRRESRAGIDCEPEAFEAAIDFIEAGLANGQSPSHIINTGDQVPFSVSTFYRLLGKGRVRDLTKLDLPRAVRYKPRSKKGDASSPNIPRELLEGRTYDDWRELTQELRDATVEVDTVVGRLGVDRQAILTLYFRRFRFQLFLLLEEHTAAEVVAALDMLDGLCGTLFPKLCPVCLFDRGTEFADVMRLENRANGTPRTRVFFCDPQQCQQRGGGEKNHEELRKILPKGKTNFDALTRRDMALIMSHVNSYCRDSLDWFSPISLARAVFPQGLLDALGVEEVAPRDVNMTPYLVPHAMLKK